MILSSHGIIGSQITQFVHLLDEYSGAAAAYSLRLLRSAYTGSAIRVRRASDNTEQDIGFVNNELDTSTLSTFCSGTNGFVKTWYDQSGNGRDSTQTTIANQPQIVSSGSVITENGKPCVDFDGSDDYFLTTLSSILTQPNTIISIHTAKSNIASIDLVDSYPNAARTLLDTSGSPFAYRLLAGSTAQSIYAQEVLVQKLAFALFKNTSSLIAVNGNLESGLSPGTNGLDTFSIGATVPFNYSNLTMQEMVIYNNDQSTNRTGIETNINTYYSIY